MAKTKIKRGNIFFMLFVKFKGYQSLKRNYSLIVEPEMFNIDKSKINSIETN
jgi:hypothetical protein